MPNDGEVETPANCPRCTGAAIAGSMPRPDPLCLVCRGTGVVPAPVAGEVETPEAAVEALLAVDHHVFFTNLSSMVGYRCDCGEAFGKDRAAAYRHERSAMVDALIAQGWTPPGTEDDGA